MNQTSPAATGTTGALIGALVVIISAISTHFKIDLSAQDQVSIAGGIVVGAHWIAEQYVARIAAKKSSAPVQQ
jgi:hypothetical protein